MRHQHMNHTERAVGENQKSKETDQRKILRTVNYTTSLDSMILRTEKYRIAAQATKRLADNT